MGSSIVHRRLRIGGMTCINCQNKIEKKLCNTAGVVEASVSYDAGTASVSYDTDVLSLKDIVGVIEGLDYEVLPEDAGQDLSRIVSILVIIVSLYVLLQQFGILNLLVPSQLADTGMGYGMLFVVGLLTSVHCIAMCGGINLSQCIPRVDSGSKAPAFLPALLYNMGRVVSYTVIGFLLGLVGFLIGGGSGTGLPTLVQGILKLIAGAVMVVMGINMLGLFPWLRPLTLRPPKFLAAKIGIRKAKATRPWFVGLLNGLMPCGPLQSMQIIALASGNPLAGALSMCLFSLGTVPLMLGLGSIVSALGKRFTQAVMNVGAVLVAVLGLAMLSQGGSLSGVLLPDQLLIGIIVFCVLGVVASVPFSKKIYRLSALVGAACLMAAALVFWGSWNNRTEMQPADGAVLADGVQVISSTLAPGSYPSISVQAGIPVRWTITAEEGSINGCNYKMILQAYDIEYVFEEGENIIEFTPEQPGTYQYTCWMGMIHGTIYVTDE